MHLGGIIQTVKDMIFPVFCLGCTVEGVHVCNSCMSSIDTSGVYLCPVCHVAEPFGMCCSDCKEHSYLNSHIAAVPYTHGTLPAKMVEVLKYQYVTDIVPQLTELLSDTIAEQNELFSYMDMIVPVPLHARRLAERGFNQSMYIADGISTLSSVPVQSALERTHYTTQQARLEKDERITNMDGVFSLVADIDIVGADILLVDDVYTTGSTMQSAAKTLHECGASSVVGCSIARG